MLALVAYYDDAIASLKHHGDQLSVLSLPATIFLMQQDEINHYRHALTHYLDLTLTEPYLQDSSIGSPYEKWAKFTNKDFGGLEFAIQNLLRYTARLIGDTTDPALRPSARKPNTNRYIELLGDLKNKKRSTGIRIGEDETLVITAPSFSDEEESLMPGSLCERQQSCPHSILWDTTYQIGDRSLLRKIKEKGLAEVELIANRSNDFAQLCRQAGSHSDPFGPFDRLHESWCR